MDDTINVRISRAKKRQSRSFGTLAGGHRVAQFASRLVREPA